MTRKSKQPQQQLVQQPSIAAASEPHVLVILRIAEICQMILGNGLLQTNDQLTLQDRLNLVLASSSVFFATVDALRNVGQGSPRPVSDIVSTELLRRVALYEYTPLCYGPTVCSNLPARHRNGRGVCWRGRY